MRECWYVWYQADRPHGLLKIRYTDVNTDGVWAKVVGLKMGALHPQREIEVDETRCYDHETDAYRALSKARETQLQTMQWNLLRAMNKQEQALRDLQRSVEDLADQLSLVYRAIDCIDSHLKGESGFCGGG